MMIQLCGISRDRYVHLKDAVEMLFRSDAEPCPSFSSHCLVSVNGHSAKDLKYMIEELCDGTIGPE